MNSTNLFYNSTSYQTSKRMDLIASNSDPALRLHGSSVLIVLISSSLSIFLGFGEVTKNFLCSKVHEFFFYVLNQRTDQIAKKICLCEYNISLFFNGTLINIKNTLFSNTSHVNELLPPEEKNEYRFYKIAKNEAHLIDNFFTNYQQRFQTTLGLNEEFFHQMRKNAYNEWQRKLTTSIEFTQDMQYRNNILKNINNFQIEQTFTFPRNLSCLDRNTIARINDIFMRTCGDLPPREQAVNQLEQELDFLRPAPNNALAIAQIHENALSQPIHRNSLAYLVEDGVKKAYKYLPTLFRTPANQQDLRDNPNLANPINLGRYNLQQLNAEAILSIANYTVYLGALSGYNGCGDTSSLNNKLQRLSIDEKRAVIKNLIADEEVILLSQNARLIPEIIQEIKGKAQNLYNTRQISLELRRSFDQALQSTARNIQNTYNDV